ncbi:hypothetical protein Q3G72_028610 [Acer saccharum]|nr:hypothetical protein Q3G72_028610 [Acer saccharum]
MSVDNSGSAKRARSEDEIIGRNDFPIRSVRREAMGSFKSKLLDPRESAGKIQDEKEKTPFGPWMLVTYGKQGNQYNGNRVWNNGNNAGRGVVGRKNYGNGKIAGSSADTNFRKNTNAMNTDVAKKVNVSKMGGSRFDILREEGDVMMKENEGQLNMSSGKNVGNGSKSKDLGILYEITNLSEEHGEQVTKKGCNLLIKTQKNKKSINKKVVKPFEKGGHLKKGVVFQKEDSCTLRTIESKGEKQILEPALTKYEDSIIDSTNVLQQFHKEVSEFKAKCVGETSMDHTNTTCEGLNSVSKDSSNGVSDNFDIVASDLIEAITVISE